jgi:quercetin dioxygenase-like cupin family protein
LRAHRQPSTVTASRFRDPARRSGAEGWVAKRFLGFVVPFAGENKMTETNAKYTRWKDVEIESLTPLLGRQLIVGTNLMVARVLLKKGAVVPMHSHHNEQVTYILEGALHFLIEGREIDVHAGEVLCIPPHVPHQATALEDTVDLDVFNPPRQDWIDKTDAYLRQGSGGETK